MYGSLVENYDMNYPLPYIIENCIGEKLSFLRLVPEPGGDKLLVENFVKPGVGPVMHTHFLQDEVLTVEKGRIGYQLKGGAPQYAEVGETVVFHRGVAHKFWNAGDEELHCTGYIKPANSIVFFLTSLFEAQNKSGSARPELFDGAYLVKRYASEYEMNEMPWLVKKLVIPVVYFAGKLLGKYKHFKNAPGPIKLS
jgi:quercetin dioxygenase-like cupin family protein